MFEVSSMVLNLSLNGFSESTEIPFTFIVVFIRELCLIHNIGCKTFIVQRTFISNSAIASKIFFVEIQNLFVVWRYSKFHVSQSIVSYFNRITVDNEPLYINKNSNGPPTVIKQIPKAISKRISHISSSKEIYDQNISYYKEALKHSGYDNIPLPYNPW